MASFSRGTQFPEMETTSDFVENGHIGIESSAITVVIISRIRCPLLHLCRLFLFRYQSSRKNRRFVHILCTIVLGHFFSPSLVSRSVGYRSVTAILLNFLPVKPLKTRGPNPQG
jgi:hypothetical protein